LGEKERKKKEREEREKKMRDENFAAEQAQRRL